MKFGYLKNIKNSESIFLKKVCRYVIVVARQVIQIEKRFMIKDVKIKKITRHCDDRGFFSEIFTSEDSFFPKLNKLLIRKHIRVL